MDARIVATVFRQDSSPGWPCPTCEKGQIVQDPDHPILLIETAASERDRAESGGLWEPEWWKERFAGILRCTDCRDPVVIAGETSVEYDREANFYGTVLHPYFVRPAPRLLQRPATMPPEVERHLCKAEELFWSSPSGAANAVRAAIEVILTNLGIPRRKRNKKRKLVRQTLHQRIERFSAKNPDLGAKMLAVKWIGNAGSHEGEEPTRDDLYDCLELMEHVLEEVYEKKSKRLNALAKTIDKVRGPRSRAQQRA